MRNKLIVRETEKLKLLVVSANLRDTFHHFCFNWFPTFRAITIDGEVWTVP